MRGRLCFLAFISLVAGIVAGRYLNGPGVILSAVVLILASLLLHRLAPRYAVFAVIAVYTMVLGMLTCSLERRCTESGIMPVLSRSHRTVALGGYVAGDMSTHGDRASFLLAVREVSHGGRTWRTRENVVVWADGAEHLEAVATRGAGLEVKGRLTPTAGDGGWLIEHGVASSISTSWRETSRAPGFQDRGSMLVDGVRRAIARRYRVLFDERVSGFMEGVTLSKLDGMEPRVLVDLKNAGLSHLVAVSGLNVGASAALVLAMMSAAGAGRKAKYAGAGAIALAVTGVAAFRPSAVRSLLMAALGFIAALTGRRYDPLSALSFAGILIAVMNPMAVFDAGFQYSFAATLAILAGARAVSHARSISGLRAVILVSAAAQLGVFPFIIAQGEGIPVTALAANVVAVPLAGVVLFTGWASAAISVISLRFGVLSAQMPGALSRVILATASACSSVPRSGFNRGAPALAAMLLYAGGLLALVVAARKRTSFYGPLVAIAASLILLFAPMVGLPWQASNDRLTMLDVGQGDAVLVQDHHGANILVDGGPDGRVILDKLERRGVRRIDLLVLSHPHMDHLAGLIEVVRSLQVISIVDTGVAGDGGDGYREFRDAAADRDIPVLTVREGDTLRVSSSTTMEVLHPGSGCERPEDAGYDNLNDCSMVLMARIGGAKVLLAGDVEKDGQLDMLRLHPDISCDVLKVPHQGASNAVTRELMQRTRPSLALVSVEKGNSYGHPSRQCMDLSREYGAELLRTDEMGDIEVSFHDGRIIARTEKERI